MKKWILIVIPVLLCLSAAKSQTITGNIKDSEGKGLGAATVTLKQAKDSAISKIAVTNSSGKYAFDGVAAGNYFVSATFTGYSTISSDVFGVAPSGEVTVPVLTLTEVKRDLQSVTVTARKPMIEVKADKTILNVEGSVNAVGQDALELLRKSPGVMVDKDENISMSGKNGVQVYIDGRPTPLNGKDLSDYLKSIQSSSVESIELITNPSAKYDAAGNAGIINIKLKKNKAYGTNGSINAGYNIGITPKYNGGISLNHRNKNINLFGNYSYNENRNEMQMTLHRQLLDTIFDQKSQINMYSQSHNFKAGADYTINNRMTVGAMVNGTLSNQDINNYSRTEILYVPTKQLDRTLIADNTSTGKRDNVNANVNFRYADSSSRELNIDADYGAYRIGTDQFQPNEYFDPAGGFIYRRIYNMIAPTDIDIYSAKADYEQNFKKGRLGIGAKSSYVKSANDFERFDIINTAKRLDTLRSNDFLYKENINAGYINYNRQFKGFMIQAGLRVEHTHATGQSTGYRQNGNGYTGYDSTFTRDYVNAFPSAAITFNKKPTSQLSFTYSRRIDRPSYQNLNPFEFKLDEYTFQKGNTDLRPQYTSSFGVTHTYKYKLTTTLNYSHVSDVFTQLIDTAELSKSFITQKNLATQDIISLNVSYPFQYKWYSVFANVNAYYSHYKADFGPESRTIDLDVYAVNLYAQQTFRLGKGWTGEMSGWYSSPTLWQGTFKSEAMWSLDAGIQKTVLKGKGNIKASVSDIFKTIEWKSTSNFAGQSVRNTGGFESRQFKLNFNYRFGNNQVKAARQRKTSTEEENKRVGGQGTGIGGGSGTPQ